MSVSLRLPQDAPDLDPLQREGAAALLDNVLDQVSDADDVGGIAVVVDRHWVGVHPQGALVLLVVDAPALEVAEHAASDIMQQVLERTDLLTDWQVSTCEVGFDERFVDAGLNAADGPGAPPADVADRAEWQTQRGSAVEPDGGGGEVEWRAWILGLAPQLRAFDLDVFDLASDGSEQARLAAGALIFAAGIVIDELFEDLDTLTDDGSTVADSGPFFVLDGLPPQFANRYDIRFVHKFLIAAVTVTARLTQPDWTTPACVAEALALHLVVGAARNLLDEHELLDEDALAYLYSGFDDAAYDDVDHEWLYQPEMDGFENDPEFTEKLGGADMHIDDWFHQLPHASSHIHLYIADNPTPRVDDDPR